MDTQPTAFIAALAPVSPQRAHFGAHFGAHSPPPCMAWTQQHRALARPAAAARGAMCRFAPAAGARAARGAHRRARRSQGRRRRRTRRPSPRRRPPARARAPPGRARPAPRRRLRAARVTPGAPAQALAMPRTQALVPSSRVAGARPKQGASHRSVQASACMRATSGSAQWRQGMQPRTTQTTALWWRLAAGAPAGGRPASGRDGNAAERASSSASRLCASAAAVTAALVTCRTGAATALTFTLRAAVADTCLQGASRHVVCYV